MGIAAADNDWIEVAVSCPVDGCCDLVEGVGVEEDWALILAFEDGCDGFEALVYGVVGLGVGDGLVENVVDIVEIAFSERDDESGVAGDGEVFVGPAVGIHDGGASWDGAAGGEDADGEDAVGPGDWDDC